MLRFKTLSVFLFALLAIGCKAQTPTPNDAQLNRRIETIVRTQFNLPADVAVSIGTRHASQFPGFETLPITLARDTRSQTIEFLISTDNSKLAKLEQFDLKSNPIFNISTDNRPIRGSASAPLTVISFDDLQCPYCARMHQQLFPKTLDRYKGMVKFVYKDYPLSEIHPWAIHAAVDANCLFAQNQETYWKYVDYVHAHPQEMASEDRSVSFSNQALDRIALQHATIDKLDEGKLNACLQSQNEAAVRASMKEAEALNLDGAPVLYVDGEKINGAVPVEQVWTVIDRALKAHGIEPPPIPAEYLQKPATSDGGR